MTAKRIQEINLSYSEVLQCRDAEGKSMPEEEFPITWLLTVKEKIDRGVADRDTVLRFPDPKSGEEKKVTVGELVDQGRFGKMSLPFHVVVKKFENKETASIMLRVSAATTAIVPSEPAFEMLKVVAQRAREAGCPEKEIQEVLMAAGLLALAEGLRR